MSVTGINLNIEDGYKFQPPEFSVSWTPSSVDWSGLGSDGLYSDYYKKLTKKPNIFLKARDRYKNMTPEDKAAYNEAGKQLAPVGFNLVNLGVEAGWFGEKAEGGEAVTNFTKTLSSIKTGNPYIDGATTILNTGANLLNTVFAEKLPTFSADLEIMTKASTYSGTSGDINEAMNNSGKNIGLFGNKGGLKRQIESAHERYNKLSNIITTNDDRNAIVSGNLDLQQYNTQLKLQGINFLNRNAGNTFKDGGKIESLEEFIVEEIPNWEFVEVSEIESFKNGGEFNVIPDGQFHSRKHNMDLDGITKKGIPVVSEEDGGIVQHAEIERNEIILRKSVTEKLEKWRDTFYNDDSKKKDRDEACLKAGKLLVEEILNNTLDNTGLLNNGLE